MSDTAFTITIRHMSSVLIISVPPVLTITILPKSTSSQSPQSTTTVKGENITPRIAPPSLTSPPTSSVSTRVRVHGTTQVSVLAVSLPQIQTESSLSPRTFLICTLPVVIQTITSYAVQRSTSYTTTTRPLSRSWTDALAARNSTSICLLLHSRISLIQT